MCGLDGRKHTSTAGVRRGCQQPSGLIHSEGYNVITVLISNHQQGSVIEEVEMLLRCRLGTELSRLLAYKNFPLADNCNSEENNRRKKRK